MCYREVTLDLSENISHCCVDYKQRYCLGQSATTHTHTHTRIRTHTHIHTHTISVGMIALHSSMTVLTLWHHMMLYSYNNIYI